MEAFSRRQTLQLMLGASQAVLPGAVSSVPADGRRLEPQEIAALSEVPQAGTLVYLWQPQASWIDGVPLDRRDGKNVVQPVHWGPIAGGGGASLGGDLVKSVSAARHPASYKCFNRAPTGHPSLEIRSVAGVATSCNFTVDLFDKFAGSPRYMRVVFELKTCQASDPTTYKGQGVGTTGGRYPDWIDSKQTPKPTHVKYYIGSYAGDAASGGGVTNWWGDPKFPIRRGGHRVQCAPTSRRLHTYIYNFDRPKRFGEIAYSDHTGDEPGIHGVWHRIELEIQLTDPATVPDNARRSNPPTKPSRTGDGYARIYLAKDIDGELGPAGPRELIASLDGLIYFCKADDVGGDDNLHLRANMVGPWFELTYGGTLPAQAEAWAWIRKVEVYV